MRIRIKALQARRKPRIKARESRRKLCLKEREERLFSKRVKFGFGWFWVGLGLV